MPRVPQAAAVEAPVTYDHEARRIENERKPTCPCGEAYCRIDPADGLPRRVLFLDFDGVLNAHYGWERDDPETSTYVTHECVAELSRVLGACQDVMVCISSTWRRFYTIDFLRKFLADFEIPGHRVVSRTPMRMSEGPRGNEIQNWLNDHPFVKRFVIVDDDADMLHLLPKLVRTDAKVGLTTEKAKEIIERFGS